MRSRPKMTSQVSKENGTEARECLLNGLVEGAGWLAVKGRPFRLWDSRGKSQNSNRLLSASSRLPSKLLRKIVHDVLDVASNLLVLLVVRTVDHVPCVLNVVS